MWKAEGKAVAQVAVLGAGTGGQAAAADCALAGHAVTLADLPQVAPALEPIRDGRTIEILGRGPDPLPAQKAAGLSPQSL